MMEKQGVCVMCQFYEPTRKDHGTCHRYPPIRGADDGDWQPDTYALGWCGEFVKREEKSQGEAKE